jgi:hypothetical protein
MPFRGRVFGLTYRRVLEGFDWRRFALPGPGLRMPAPIACLSERSKASAIGTYIQNIALEFKPEIGPDPPLTVARSTSRRVERAVRAERDGLVTRSASRITVARWLC